MTILVVGLQVRARVRLMNCDFAHPRTIYKTADKRRRTRQNAGGVLVDKFDLVPRGGGVTLVVNGQRRYRGCVRASEWNRLLDERVVDIKIERLAPPIEP